MGYRELRNAKFALEDDADGDDEFAKVTIIRAREYQAQQHREDAVRVREPLPSLVSAGDLLGGVAWGALERAGEVPSDVPDELSVGLPHLLVGVHSPWPAVLLSRGSQGRVARRRPSMRSGMLRARRCIRSPGNIFGAPRLRESPLKMLGLPMPVSSRARWYAACVGAARILRKPSL